MTAGLSSSTFSVFVKPMGDDLGWSRSSTILATTTGTVAAAVFGHFLGTVLDKRHGARLLTTGGMITIGVCAILFGFVPGDLAPLRAFLHRRRCRTLRLTPAS